MIKLSLTRQEYEDILSKAFLNEEEQKIIKMMLLGESRTKIALTLSMSERNLSRKIKKIVEKIEQVL